MSYIPDCRRDENYNQKYLNEKDSEFIRGFDWCSENAVDVFFDNMEEFFGIDSYLMHILKEEIPEQDHEEYVWINSFDERIQEKRTVKTYLDAIRAHLVDWVEMHRDELITSMIDNMKEEEYKAIKEKVDRSEAE
jgi:hypothetical protein